MHCRVPVSSQTVDVSALQFVIYIILIVQHLTYYMTPFLLVHLHTSLQLSLLPFMLMDLPSETACKGILHPTYSSRLFYAGMATRTDTQLWVKRMLSTKPFCCACAQLATSAAAEYWVQHIGCATGVLM